MHSSNISECGPKRRAKILKNNFILHSRGPRHLGTRTLVLTRLPDTLVLALKQKQTLTCNMLREASISCFWKTSILFSKKDTPTFGLIILKYIYILMTNIPIWNVKRWCTTQSLVDISFSNKNPLFSRSKLNCSNGQLLYGIKVSKKHFLEFLLRKMSKVNYSSNNVFLSCLFTSLYTIPLLLLLFFFFYQSKWLNFISTILLKSGRRKV